MNLLFHQAALGDFVLTFPLLRRLPGPTTVIAPWSKASLAGRLLKDVSAMDIELWEFTRLHAAGGPTSVSPAIRELFEQAQRIISFVSRPDDAWTSNVARLAPQSTIACIQPRPPATWSRHVTDWHSEQLTALELPTPAPRDPSRQPRRLDGPTVIHPGSGGRNKCWPADRFEALIEALRSAGRDVIPILGEAEIDRWNDEVIDRWRARYGVRIIDTLDALCDVLRTSSRYVGNDSGPTHLAAQLGLTTVALFGPTDPRVWAPIGPDVRILAPDTPRPMDWLPVEAVVAACR